MLEWVGVLNREVSTKLCLKMRGRHAEFRDYEARNPHLTPLCHSALPSKSKGKFWREVGWRRDVDANWCNTLLK